MAVLARGRVEEGGLVAEWIFTDRHGGVSSPPYDTLNVGASVGDDPADVEANRSLIAAELGAPRLALARQVHGRDVIRVREWLADPPDADAVMTDALGVPVATQVADCVPILLAAPGDGRVSAVHAGWRGVALDVVGAALEALAPSGRVHAWIGPAICAGCYEVSADVRDEVASAAPGSAAVTRMGTPSLDLRAGVAGQLARLGVPAETVGGCTFESPDLYSFRRDGVTGRQVGAIALRAAGDRP